jgi:hypothetical protein
LHPKFIAYTRQRAPLSRPPLGLRLVFATESVHYVFLDFAHDNTFRKTRLVVYFPEGEEMHTSKKKTSKLHTN